MNRHPESLGRRRGAPLLVAVLVAFLALSAVLEYRDTRTSAVPVVGDFTGEIGPAGPVYRLPPVHVVADRRTELARIERDEQRRRAAAGASVVALPKPTV